MLIIKTFMVLSSDKLIKYRRIHLNFYVINLLIHFLNSIALKIFPLIVQKSYVVIPFSI